MSFSPCRGARLLFRVDPLPHESPRGYLCRVAQEHGYAGPLFLAQIAGLSPSGLELEDSVKQISHMLRLEPHDWQAICYRHIKGRGRFYERSFQGELIRADDLNYGRPRVCPACLRERPIWWAVWDLGLVAACPIHRGLLINQCPGCKRKLGWHRPAVHKCRCGLDLRNLAAHAADSDLVAINAKIYRASGFASGEASEVDLTSYNFPQEMFGLRLGSLLRLILFVGAIWDGDRLRRKQGPFARTDLSAANEIVRAAIAMLRDWPSRLREVLQRMIPQEADSPASLGFNTVFGNFYRHLFHVLPRNEFGFLHDAFEKFVIEDWNGLVRGQHRYFTTATLRSSQWIPADEAEEVARTTADRISELVRRGQIEGTFLSLYRNGRTECWIRRDSLKRWIAARDAERARYMSRPEATRALGLTDRTIVKVASAGVMRYAQGPEHGFPSGYFFFLRADVMNIRRAFERADVLAREYSRPGELIALGHAIKNYLGRGPGLAAVIRAVVDGNLTPVGYTDRFRGITGCLFLSEDLRRYRPVEDAVVTAEGFLNYREAATALGVRIPVIRALVGRGILRASAGSRNGDSKLIRAADVRRFRGECVAVTVLAAEFGFNANAFARRHEKVGTPDDCRASTREG